MMSGRDLMRRLEQMPETDLDLPVYVPSNDGGHTPLIEVTVEHWPASRGVPEGHDGIHLNEES